VKKRNSLTLILLIFTELFYLVNITKGYYCRLNILETDKDVYYINDKIKLNASWDLNYNTDTEIAFVQIQIFNVSNKIIWNSSEFDNGGIFEESWIIDSDLLNIPLKNYSNIIYIKFFSYYFQIDSTNTVFTFLETIKIKIIKRDLQCQLIGFEDRLKFGENLEFTAKFYDNSSIKQDLYLVNQTISFKIQFNSIILYQSNYTTNHTGVITVFLSSITDLKIGYNNLVFILKNHNTYNNSKFIYCLLVEKNPVFINILDFKENITKIEDLEIRLFYYYYSNQSIKPLINQCVELIIFENNTLIYKERYNTNNLGILQINIPHNVFDIDQRSKNLLINLKFNETIFLENKIISLHLNIAGSVDSDNNKSLKMSILPISLGLIIIALIFSFMVLNNRRKNETPFTDITIRY